MFGLIVSAIVLLLVGYCTYVIFFDLDQEVGTDLSDFIRDTPDDEDTSPKTNALIKYCTKYEESGKQVLILYGTEYGFSEEIARKLFDKIADGESYQDLSWQPRVINSKDFEKIDFGREQVLLCVFSTTGDGVPPTDSHGFFEYIDSPDKSPDLSHTHYSVLALGDYNYPHYCRTGKTLDARLSSLGSSSLHARVDIDLEDWPAINGWMEGVLDGVGKLDLSSNIDYLDLSVMEEETGHSRTRPFMAKMTVKYSLTQMDSTTDKETLHTEFDLTGSELNYTSGDALGIYPLNSPPEVDALINALHTNDSYQVPVPLFCYSPKPDSDKIALREVLLKYYDLKTVKMDLVKTLVGSLRDPSQKKRGEKILKDGLSKKNEVLTSYLSDRELVDVLKDFSSFQCPVEEIVSQLRPLQPRYYSIASSPKKDCNTACVCAAVVRYSLQGTPRTGVCTTFIQDRFTVGRTCPVFISHNPDFRLPATGDVPVIMIGPGTGIAPFRAFIQERLLCELQGKNVLYFGCRHKNKDYLYEDELEKLASEGLLELRTAFSRDQPEKIYVQDLIKKDGGLLWTLMEEGAHIYVCGDAVHMAGDVHEALLGVLEGEGGLTRERAEQYMEKLGKTARYQRDVWVT